LLMKITFPSLFRTGNGISDHVININSRDDI